MRIIAGEFRGRKLLPPEGLVTRPITDRVKQSVFDALAPDIPGAIVYDCFAGTGSLGLEALSRGAKKAVFLESDRSAAAILRRNIQALGVQDRSQVIAGDAFSPPGTDSPASLLFLDPPYRFLTERADDLRNLAWKLSERHLAPGAIVVFRHALADAVDLPPLRRYDLRAYGAMAVEFLHCPSIPTNTSPPPTRPE